ncbi:sugar ABC transporter permease [Aneurinibacillus sp. Ricciae_BoGa-3]|uniref:carbohydrate ABC transporter permease n=1 Tax=Aneurinibacillus sp. Ricciae_BoGa-3 TaxID=3022697 RepID=UPI002341F92B|nr:sugar ABC transporter permease [Aneurinibacillus sp. Ricciae_BoGa-3]WCK54901.1 sugar ABC transporter permease [Aneurinibacillus sp. Ricciae_BoGa-3]
MRRWTPYLYTTPAMVIFLLFFIYPIFYMIYLSFTSWDLISPEKKFVGLQNYQDLFHSDEFWKVFSNTIVYTILTVIISIFLSLLFALWLNKKGWIYRFLQGAIFTPYIISLVSISLLWMWMMDPQYGLLNWVFSLVGLPPSKWLADTGSALYSLVLVNVWKHIGYNTLIFIAGLQSIPKEIYEAALIDRTPWWRKLTRITIPMLSPTLFFLLIINTINSFQVFDTVQIMTQGGPVNSTNMLVYYIYQYGFDFFKIGYASAAGVILLILVAIVTLFHFKFLSSRVHYR